MPKMRRIYKSGNSLVVSLPREYLEAVGIDQDDYVNVHFALKGQSVGRLPENILYLFKRPPIGSRPT
jgi:antitoxin component of MazEF toxin-antitoxin module